MSERKKKEQMNKTHDVNTLDKTLRKFRDDMYYYRSYRISAELSYAMLEAAETVYTVDVLTTLQLVQLSECSVSKLTSNVERSIHKIEQVIKLSERHADVCSETLQSLQCYLTFIEKTIINSEEKELSLSSYDHMSEYALCEVRQAYDIVMSETLEYNKQENNMSKRTFNTEMKLLARQVKKFSKKQIFEVLSKKESDNDDLLKMFHDFQLLFVVAVIAKFHSNSQIMLHALKYVNDECKCDFTVFSAECAEKVSVALAAVINEIEAIEYFKNL